MVYKKRFLILCASLAMFTVHSRMSKRKKNAVATQKLSHKNNLPLHVDVETHVVPQDKFDVAIGDVKAGYQDLSTSDKFDVEAKRKAVVELVEKGVNYFKDHTLDEVMNAFTRNKEFQSGEVYLFVFDKEGYCFAHGQESQLIWQNLYDLKDSFGAPIIQNIIAKAQAGGGWLTYQWRKASKISYVKEVDKNGKEYVVGAGYYPHSKKDAVISLVKGAVAYFNEIIAQGYDAQEAFSTMNYPQGRFVLGDLYLICQDFKGNIQAYGFAPSSVGQNDYDYQDSFGKYVNRETIEALKEVSLGKGVWVEYQSKNAPKKTYAEQVVDKNGKSYFIACGYYPDANRKALVDLVRKGFKFIETHGKSKAAEAFTSKRKKDFRYGDLSLFLYDLNGKVIAHGSIPDAVGRNHGNMQDSDGNYYVKDFIEKAKGGGGWVDFKHNNLFQTAYVELVDIGIGKFVIGGGLYPITKSETMSLLVKSGTSYLKNGENKKVFQEFTKRDGAFVRGDLFLFCFDMSGICYAFGDDNNLIWRNLMNIKDDTGKPFIKIFINTVKHGPGRVSYTINNARKVAYVEEVKKGGKSYVVGSSFFV